MAVIIALSLHLVFRLGIRKQAVFNFKEDMSDKKLSGFVFREGKRWKIDKQTMERIAQTTEAIIQHLHNSNLVDDNINLILIYDQ